MAAVAEPTAAEHTANDALNDTTDTQTTELDTTDKTVFDPANPHKLNRPWSLYYTPPVQTSSKSLDSDSWSNLLKKFITIDTVELYWQVMNNIKQPSQLTTGASYHMFVDGIKPEWYVRLCTAALRNAER